MFYLLKDGYFPEGTLRICCMLKGFKDLLQRKGLISSIIGSYFPDMTIRA